jgi:large subunit ribosomal protein L15
MRLHDLRPAEGSRKERIRVGRGIAAGKGKTAGRGTKGQKARAGGSIPAWFEGGQTPLHQRIPKLRGFKNRFKIDFEIVNVGDIDAAAQRGAFEVEAADAKPTTKTKAASQVTVNQDILRAVGLVKSLNKPLKILGAGELSAALFVVADAFSASARSKIEAAGGSVNVLEVPTAPLKALGVDGEERTAPKQSRGAEAATAREAQARAGREEATVAAEVEAAEAAAKPKGKAAKAAAAAAENEAADSEAPTPDTGESAPKTKSSRAARADRTGLAEDTTPESTEDSTASDAVEATAAEPTTATEPDSADAMTAEAAQPDTAEPETTTESAGAATEEAETASGDDA